MKHTALTPRCGGCGQASCPTCNPDEFLETQENIAKADVYALDLIETPLEAVAGAAKDFVSNMEKKHIEGGGEMSVVSDASYRALRTSVKKLSTENRDIKKIRSAAKLLGDDLATKVFNAPIFWRISPIRSGIAKVITEWLNEYGVDAKSEDLNWKDLEERLTDCFAQSLPLREKSGPTIARILGSLGHSEDCHVIECGLDNDDESCDCERKKLVEEILGDLPSTPIEQLLLDIRAVASGERQVADNDTEALAWIVGRIDGQTISGFLRVTLESLKHDEEQAKRINDIKVLEK